MNCTSINNILQSIDPNKQYQLWGLANPQNVQYCDWGQMFKRLFLMQDFQQNLTNPIYQAEIMQQQLDQVFLPICYAYSILRIFMICSVIVYVRSKMAEIMQYDERQESMANSEQNSVNRFQRSDLKTNKFPMEKQLEIRFYKWTIQTSMALEFICAIRDFVLFRGLLLYSNLMDDKQQVCYVDFYSDAFTCNKSEVSYGWREFNYSRSECNCLYFSPIKYFEDSEGSYMYFSVIFWIITESLNQGVVGFAIITLSRLNRQDTAGWAYIKPTLYKALVLIVFLMVFYSLFIFLFSIPLYYQFFENSVVIFNFFWKILTFVLIFDRLYSKIWLELKVRLSTLHSHGVEWRAYLDQVRRRIHKQSQKMEVRLKRIYDQSLQDYYSKNIQKHIEEQERETNAKLKTKWYDYLNYLLIINLIAIIGYGFLLFYGITGNQYGALFWIGFILALIQLIVFEISNLVFQLHCFFIELHKTLENEFSRSESMLSDSIS